MKAIHPGEPSFVGNLMPTKVDFIRALNFYSMHATDDLVREWARCWIRDQNLKVNLRGRTTGEIGTYAAFHRMKERGLEMDDELTDRINRAFIALHKESVPEEKPVKPVKKAPVGPQPIECLGKLDDYLDGIITGTISTGRIPNFCDSKKDVGIIHEAVTQRQARMEEERDYYHKEVYRILKSTYASILKSLGGVAEKIATERSKTSAKRTKAPAVVAKSVKYQRKYLHFESYPPERLVGARKAYVFDTKARKLTVYHATDAGFTFSGTTLKNVDAGKTMEKTVRNPEQLFVGLQPNMSSLNKLYGLIKAKERPTNGRFNENMIILCLGT